MQVLRSMDEARVAGPLQGGAVVIGNCDGVHLGHQRLVAVAREALAASARQVGVLTFDPHPLAVLRPATVPPVLTPLDAKLELLASAGADVAAVVPFDARYAATTAEEFVERDLVGALGVRHVVVGPDAKVGRDRAGIRALRPLLEARGIALHVVDPVSRFGIAVSSTRVRSALLEGNVELAAILLGRPHEVVGTIERGAAAGDPRSRSTAVLRTAALLPGLGEYLVRAVDEDAAPGVRRNARTMAFAQCSVRSGALANDSARPVAEVHLLGELDPGTRTMRIAFLTGLGMRDRADAGRAPGPR